MLKSTLAGTCFDNSYLFSDWNFSTQVKMLRELYHMHMHQPFLSGLHAYGGTLNACMHLINWWYTIAVNFGVGGGCPGVSTKIQGFRTTCPGIGRLASMGCIVDVLFLSPRAIEQYIQYSLKYACFNQFKATTRPPVHHSSL